MDHLAHRVQLRLFLFRDDVWAREKGMDCFLSVGKGSDKKPMFVELHYNQSADDQKKVVLVGKGNVLELIAPYILMNVSK